MNTTKAENTQDAQLDTIIEQNGKLDFGLVGQDGNAFAILGRFRKSAQRAGWDKDDIETVTNIATSGNYNHLLATISRTTDGV